MEELVGMAVKKVLLGFGVYSGVVESYDAEAGYFGVLYKDGDSEEVDLGEMPAILVGPPMRPKKRRRGDEVSPQANDVVVVVEAAVGDGLSNGDGPATPAERSRDEANGEVMAETVEKKRRVNPEPESARPLRRSTRQAKAAAEMEAAVAAAAAEAAEAEAAAAEAEAEAEAERAAATTEAAASATPQQPGRKRRRANGSGRYRSVTRDLGDAALDRLPPKPELPPSSQALDLDGLSVLDVFQVYSYLRATWKISPTKETLRQYTALAYRPKAVQFIVL